MITTLWQTHDAGPMEISEKASRKERAKVKAKSRHEDQQRLDEGEDPDVIQRENSIVPPGFFVGAEISNLKDIIGK